MKYFSFLLLTFSITTTLFAQISHPGKQPWPVMDDSPNYFEIREPELMQMEIFLIPILLSGNSTDIKTRIQMLLMPVHVLQTGHR
ncbi:MAG: hypothetical protein IPI31_10665 [Bacteroidetes bacterium]|nr:hypothetical protein [Bacteroidota bacterium]